MAWLCDPESEVSAHYLIDQLGGIWHLVHEQNIAWHAGVSLFENMENVNRFSVGIELVNPNDGSTPYPIPQINACADLVADICQDHNLTIQCVVGHADIAPGRKNDPLAFPWEDFRIALADKGVKSGGA